MAETNQRKMNARISDIATEYNRTVFLIKQIVKQTVSTAIPVRVDGVQRGGEGSGALYVSATPLVGQTDADGNLLDPVSIPRLPYFRLQHGTAAVICDPVPGDIGLAIFAQQDTSNLSGGNEPVVPGSYRCFDMSDGFYIGGFWGQAPQTFVHIEQSGEIVLTAPNSVKVNAPQIVGNCETAEVNATESVKVTAPTTTINGNLIVNGLITGTGGLALSGSGSGATATITGTLQTTGDVVAGDISLESHVHGGVTGGGDTTSAPQ